MKKLKLFGLLALVTMTSLMLVACGTQNGGEEEAMKNQAKQTYLETVLKTKDPSNLVGGVDLADATVDDITFKPFLGIYGGSLVAVFYGNKYHGVHFEHVISLEINGLDFSYSNGYPVLVWNNNSISTLEEAYGQGLLSKANLESVHSLYIFEH